MNIKLHSINNIKILYLILLTLFYPITLVLADPPLPPINCEPALISHWDTLQKSPDVRLLLRRIQKEGPLFIQTNKNPLAQQFGAFWDLDRRVICVDVGSSRSYGDILGSILFELHNAAATSRLNRLDKLAAEGQLDKENYVRAVEFVEYQNSLSASKITEEGIRKGIFPKTAFLPTYSSFDEHYYYQQVGGHSAWIANNYDRIQKQK